MQAQYTNYVSDEENVEECSNPDPNSIIENQAEEVENANGKFLF